MFELSTSELLRKLWELRASQLHHHPHWSLTSATTPIFWLFFSLFLFSRRCRHGFFVDFIISSLAFHVHICLLLLGLELKICTILYYQFKLIFFFCSKIWIYFLKKFRWTDIWTPNPSLVTFLFNWFLHQWIWDLTNLGTKKIICGISNLK